MNVALAVALVLAQTTREREWERMDYGPFLSATVKTHRDVVVKAIVVRLGPDATVCYDTDLMRCAGGWTGGFLKLMGPVFDGAKVPLAKGIPHAEGLERFGTPAEPGWARGDSFRDPRPTPYGPLPDLKYRGLYVHGTRVVLAYTVGKTEVLELPAFHGSISRTFRMGPSTETLSLLVAEGETLPEKAVTGIPAAWEVVGKRLILRVAPHAEPILFKVTLGAVEDAPIEDPLAFTRGGPARYREEVVTRGTLGKEPGAYAVDTLTAPERNPWNAWMRFGDLDFFSDSRAAATTWSGDVWVISGIDDKLDRLSWRRFATGLHQPLGVRIVDGDPFVAGRDQITRLRDLNGDGEADFYENFNNDIASTENYHEYVMGLETDAEGNFYTSKGAPSLALRKDPPIIPHQGTILKISRDGRSLEVLATGVRASNGLGIGPDGFLTCSDNDGHWGPSSRINRVRAGKYYGDPLTSHVKPAPPEYEPPICWIPKKIDNSAGAQVWVTDDRWGPLKGQMVHTSYGSSGLLQVLLEEVNGRPQGGVIRFPLQFNSGIMRARFRPADGQLYVCGLRAWDTNAATDGTLQRVRYTGRPVHTLRGLRTTHTGLELTFTNPLDREGAADPDAWAVERWNYLYSEKYGSPEYSLANPGKTGRDDVAVKAARVSADGLKVELDLEGHRPVMQMLVRFRGRAADGSKVALELYNTVHEIP